MIKLEAGCSKYTPCTGITDEDVFCGVCGCKMEVKMRVKIATQMAEAMAGLSHFVDHYFCPEIEKVWHRQAQKLQSDIVHSPSKFYSDLLQKEVDQILETRIPSKTEEELTFVNLGS